MKIVMTRDLRLGLKRLVEGDEIDLPDRFAQRLVTAGRATVANDKPAKRATKKSDEEEEEKPKNYKTRQIKAEDSD